MNGSARLRSLVERRRALTILAILAAGLAAAAAVAAFTVGNSANGIVLETETVAVSTLPVTSPTTVVTSPATAATSVRSPEVAPPATAAATTTTTPPPRVPPVELMIDDLGIDHTVLPVGLDAEGAMEVPEISDVGWYLHGAVPGHPGATVLVAHVAWNGTKGPFHQLGSLDLGARIEVQLDDGSVTNYEVVKRTMYDKDALPGDLWRNTGPETLVLITCGGDFDRSARSYEQNIVVYATPVQGDAAPQISTSMASSRQRL